MSNRKKRKNRQFYKIYIYCFDILKIAQDEKDLFISILWVMYFCIIYQKLVLYVNCYQLD